MSQDDLKELLQRVHSELSKLESLDNESSQLLSTVMDDIHNVRGDAPTPEESHGLIDRLKDAAQDFEEDHPNLTEAVGRVVDALSRLGI
jgi:hypothetical protein